MSKQETISQKIAKLDRQIEWFYSDDFTLDLALDNYKQSIALTKSIEEDLDNLKNEIKILSEDFSKS